MQTRQLGAFDVSAIGLGCMSMSHAYGVPNRSSATATLHKALDLGYNFLDTAALYGFGENEKLLGDVLNARRDEYILASKCGLIRGSDGKRAVDGRPHIIRQTCEASLRQLQTEIIDLYYLHRVDPDVPVEESVGALADLQKEGKIHAIGLSEVSAQTLRRAYKEHPITALQSEYSLWTRNPENEVLSACRDLGVGFVAFSPLGRGFLTGTIRDPNNFVESDLRLSMPRFLTDNLQKNLELIEPLTKLANEKDCTIAQLSLAWVLAQDQIIIAIPGTQDPDHVAENALAVSVQLSPQDIAQLNSVINPHTVQGDRYNATTLATMET